METKKKLSVITLLLSTIQFIFSCESKHNHILEITVATGYCECDFPRGAVKIDNDLNIISYIAKTEKYYKGQISKDEWVKISSEVNQKINFNKLDSIYLGADGLDIEIVVHYEDGRKHLIGQGGNLPDSVMNVLMKIAKLPERKALMPSSPYKFETSMHVYLPPPPLPEIKK